MGSGNHIGQYDHLNKYKVYFSQIRRNLELGSTGTLWVLKDVIEAMSSFIVLYQQPSGLTFILLVTEWLHSDASSLYST